MAKSTVQQANKAGMPMLVQNWMFLGSMGRTVVKLWRHSIISHMEVVMTPALNSMRTTNTCKQRHNVCYVFASCMTMSTHKHITADTVVEVEVL